ncbi:MAG: protein-L-isoaspartate(D-aspartate) O-methyltransferase [Pirellulaceae bacterium]
MTLIGILVCAGLAVGAEPGEQAWAEMRHRMVEEEIVAAGIQDPRVQAAIRDTPRHQFVPSAQRRLSYYDMALPIGGGQTISPPFIVAYMTEKLEPKATDKVLEIGTGSGYQAAVLSPLVADVYSIEIVESLARTSAATLRRLGYQNVHTKLGDGYQGWPEHAPFDKIIVTCSPEKVPPALVEQLREGGLIVVPLGERYQQTLYRLRKVDGKLEREPLEPTFFVPMTGRAEELREQKDGEGLPRVHNGGFETMLDEGVPAGWYYVRQATQIEDGAAPEGRHWLRFRNETPGRGAQALQSLAMDGRRVKQLEVSLWIEARNIQAAPMSKQLGHIELTFFDENRGALGTSVLGRWQGDIAPARRTHTVRIPPRARLAVMAVGLFGATGELSVDDVQLRVLDD